MAFVRMRLSVFTIKASIFLVVLITFMSASKNTFRNKHLFDDLFKGSQVTVQTGHRKGVGYQQFAWPQDA